MGQTKSIDEKLALQIPQHWQQLDAITFCQGTVSNIHTQVCLFIISFTQLQLIHYYIILYSLSSHRSARKTKRKIKHFGDVYTYINIAKKRNKVSQATNDFWMAMILGGKYIFPFSFTLSRPQGSVVLITLLDDTTHLDHILYYIVHDWAIPEFGLSRMVFPSTWQAPSKVL